MASTCPGALQIEFSKTIQHITEDSGTEISPAAMWEAFQSEYLPENPRIALVSHEVRSSESRSNELSAVTAHLSVDGEDVEVMGTGNGPIEAFVKALNSALGTEIDVVDYAEHALGAGKDATAVAYVETRTGNGEVRWGVGTHPNIMTASLHAVVSALLRQHAAIAERQRDAFVRRTRKGKGMEYLSKGIKQR